MSADMQPMPENIDGSVSYSHEIHHKFSDSLISVVKAGTRGTASVPARRTPRSPVHGGGWELVGTGGWFAESLRTPAKRVCGAVAGQCCPDPALCERNGEAARYTTVENVYPDLGVVR